MRAKKKPSKKAAIKKLHGALRSLLDKPVSEIKDDKRTSGLPEILPSSRSSSDRKARKSSSPAVKGKHSPGYVVSKEDQLIPKLSDNEIMERHKLADENMKRVWTSIIQKYETIEDQGDVLDLQTGEVVEDNGHIRGLSQNTDTQETRYESILKDIIDLKEDDGDNDKFALWGDDDVDEQEDGDYRTESEEEEDGIDEETEYADYKQLLKGKMDD